jgi:hypothetical protein
VKCFLSAVILSSFFVVMPAFGQLTPEQYRRLAQGSNNSLPPQILISDGRQYELVDLPTAKLGDLPQDRSATFTDPKGKKLVGDLVKIEITLTIKNDSGKLISLSWSKLSAEDQKKIRYRIKRLELPAGAAAEKALAQPVAEPQAPKSRPVAPWTPDRSSDDLRRDAVGMSKESLVLWLGPPVRTFDSGDEKSLVYEEIAVDPDSHKKVGAVITIRSGRVTRVFCQ